MALLPDMVGIVVADMGRSLAFYRASEVDLVYYRMIGAGHHGHREPWDAFWGQRYAVLLDPDGNTVDIFAPL